MTNSRWVKRLKAGDFSYGCAGRHHGRGTEDCPRELHHHHDEFCSPPTMKELAEAGVSYSEWVDRKRSNR